MQDLDYLVFLDRPRPTLMYWSMPKL